MAALRVGLTSSARRAAIWWRGGGVGGRVVVGEAGRDLVAAGCGGGGAEHGGLPGGEWDGSGTTDGGQARGSQASDTTGQNICSILSAVLQPVKRGMGLTHTQ